MLPTRTCTCTTLQTGWLAVVVKPFVFDGELHDLELTVYDKAATVRAQRGAPRHDANHILSHSTHKRPRAILLLQVVGPDGRTLVSLDLPVSVKRGSAVASYNRTTRRLRLKCEPASGVGPPPPEVKATAAAADTPAAAAAAPAEDIPTQRETASATPTTATTSAAAAVPTPTQREASASAAPSSSATAAWRPSTGGHPLEWRTDSLRTNGRRWSAARDVEVGEVVLCEEPLASVLQTAYETVLCHHCYGRLPAPGEGQGGAPISCARCDSVRFCSASCRQNSTHRHECAVLASAQGGAGASKQPGLRLLLRLIGVAASAGEPGARARCSLSALQGHDHHHHHSDDHGHGHGHVAEAKAKAQLAADAASARGVRGFAEGRALPEDEVLHIIGAIRTNGMFISDSEGRRLGNGEQPRATMLLESWGSVKLKEKIDRVNLRV